MLKTSAHHQQLPLYSHPDQQWTGPNVSFHYPMQQSVFGLGLVYEHIVLLH
jgi:hypothetical protein